MGKRKRMAVAETAESKTSPSVLPADVASIASTMMPPMPSRRLSNKRAAQPPPANIDTNPRTNPLIEDKKMVLRASPDAEQSGEIFEVERVTGKKGRKAFAPTTSKPDPKAIPSGPSPSGLSDIRDVKMSQSALMKSTLVPIRMAKSAANGVEGLDRMDPEGEGDEDAVDPEELKEALTRPPPVNSSYLPLPWRGRLGYACLNTYLRSSNPSVFSSRTCRIASILEHRHPLRDASQPEHATKNRPDREQPADIKRGQAYVEALGLANAKDIPKMLRWNHKYGIRFLRLSSEMFPFASHEIYGYKLAPFASEALANAGRVAAELGHRLTTHPGQFTQLGSPRNEVIAASIRDLEYHAELLDLLKLPPQQDRDAVMILHMGGIFGDKAATIERFKGNHVELPQNVKKRLVLENDDVCYSVHDLLPVCEELNIPLVLDYHHHNIIFDSNRLREGTLDIMSLYGRIKATWDRKGITQKMHYSEPTPSAITKMQRRKHNPRVATLPPCAPDMDLMIEAKDKEQAVFELMRTFKLPGYDSFNDLLPHVRADENRPWKPPQKRKTPKKKAQDTDVDIEEEVQSQPPPLIPNEDVGMGGPEGRVYWPPGMEEWLRPKKREVKPRDTTKGLTTSEKAAQRRAEKAALQVVREASVDDSEPKTVESTASENGALPKIEIEKTKTMYGKVKGPKSKSAVKVAAKRGQTKKSTKAAVPTPSTSDFDDEDEENSPELTDLEDEDSSAVPTGKKRKTSVAAGRRQSGRAKKAALSYAESDAD